MSFYDGAISQFSKSLSTGVDTGIKEVGSKIQYEALNKVQELSGDIPSLFGTPNLNSGFKALTNSAIAAPIQGVMSFATNRIPNIGSTDISSVIGKTASSNNANNFVKLINKTTGEQIIFNVMPVISESRDASYSEVPVVQFPGSILKYEKTSNRTWGIGQIRLISRNPDEATKNQDDVNKLRSWLMPYYGYGTEQENGKMLGAPPDILYFSAYGSKNIPEIPTVLTHLTISWPNDVDYIETTSKEPFPVIMTVELSLSEAWSPREYSGFSLQKYRNADLTGAYNPAFASQPPPAPVASNTSASSVSTTGTDQTAVGKKAQVAKIKTESPVSEALKAGGGPTVAAAQKLTSNKVVNQLMDYKAGPTVSESTPSGMIDRLLPTDGKTTTQILNSNAYKVSDNNLGGNYSESVSRLSTTDYASPWTNNYDGTQQRAVYNAKGELKFIQTGKK